MASHPSPSSPSPAANAGRAAIAILVIVCTAQFMLLIDDTIVNVALPSIAQDMQLTESALSWIPNAYLLMFGGFLLIGGRMADLLGRRRVFVASMAAFVTASALCGLATDPTMLSLARGAQGLAGAFMSPAALSILLATFTEERERTRALAAWSSLTALGAATGVLLGGALTELISWHWIFWINLPIGLATIFFALRTVPAGERHASAQVPGLAGAVLGTTALLALVYTVVETATYDWTSTRTLAGLGLAALLAVGFVISERRSDAPLIPNSLVRRPNIALGNAFMFLAAAGLIAMFFFVTLFLQMVKGYSPFQAGAAWIPFSMTLAVFSVITAKLVERFSAIPFLIGGVLVAAAGMVAMAQVDAGSGYVTSVLPSMMLIASGFGFAFLPILGVATNGAPEHESGIASGLLTSSQQIGGAIGIALLVTLASSVTDNRIAEGVDRATALVDGFQTALYGEAVLLIVAAGVGLLIRAFARESGRFEALPVPA
jgi:EmrB/QacA subfamily drug resistance transporter